jgi:GH15 family glucan-1,4-alpha-glucosidase
MAGYADLVAKRWHEPDAGLWEVRAQPSNHVHSKLMGWAALARAIRLSDVYRTRKVRRRRWTAARDAILADVWRYGYDQERRTFVRAYGSDDLDATLVRVPLLGFEDVDSPAVHGTMDAVRRELNAGGPLLYRYDPGSDGLRGGEGAFLPCSYWLAQALAVAGRADEAAGILGELTRHDLPLGLLPEEVDPTTGAYLGNFPQAFTHAAHVAAGLAIRDAAAAGPQNRVA